MAGNIDRHSPGQIKNQLELVLSGKRLVSGMPSFLHTLNNPNSPRQGSLPVLRQGQALSSLAAQAARIRATTSPQSDARFVSQPGPAIRQSLRNEAESVEVGSRPRLFLLPSVRSLLQSRRPQAGSPPEIVVGSTSAGQEDTPLYKDFMENER